MGKDLWLTIGPHVLRASGEGMIALGILLETVGVALQNKGVDLLEARNRLLRSQRERELRRKRIEQARQGHLAYDVP